MNRLQYLVEWSNQKRLCLQTVELIMTLKDTWSSQFFCEKS